MHQTPKPPQPSSRSPAASSDRGPATDAPAFDPFARGVPSLRPDVASVLRLSDQTLLESLRQLARSEAELTAALLVHLAEVDDRRAYLCAGYSSLFAYCMQALGFSESTAGKRIQVARLCRRLPQILDFVATGRMHLSGLCVLAPVLLDDDAETLLARARGRSRREIECLVAEVRPPPAPCTARPRAPSPVAPALFATLDPTPDAMPGAPEPAPGSEPASPASCSAAGQEATPTRVPSTSHVASDPRGDAPPHPPMAASPETARAAGGSGRTSGDPRVSLSARITARCQALLERARGLLAHALPCGDTGAVLERGLELLVADLERERFGVGRRTRRPGAAKAARPRNASATSTTTHDEHAPGHVDCAPVGAAVPPTPPTPPAPVPASCEPVPHAETSAPVHVPPQAGSPAEPPPASRAPRPDSPPGWNPTGRRHIPASIRREVYLRDQGRCTYVGTDGHRCDGASWIEFDHLVPLARGGPSTAANLTIRCGAHNAHAARETFGEGHVAARIREHRGKPTCISP